MEKLRKYAILFDLDGTLVDTLGDICGHINQVRRDYGLGAKTVHELQGDHEVDRMSAEAAGVRFLGAVYGFGGVFVPEDQAIHVFPELLDKIDLS